MEENQQVLALKNIAIIGAGGVGGFLGSKLAIYYQNKLSLHFVVSNKEHYDEINEHGLTLFQEQQSINTRDYKLYKKIRDLPPPELIILAVKSYSLLPALKELSAIVNKDTYILPLLNGVNNKEIIESLIPPCNLLQGCIYLSSYIYSPGIIKQSGLCHLYFGSDHCDKKAMLNILKFFLEAGITTTLSNDILRLIWEKYLYICPISCITAAYQVTIGDILGSSFLIKKLEQLMQEIALLAKAKKIKLSENIIKNSLSKMKNFKSNATSSFYLDVTRGRQTEVDIFLYYILKEAQKLGIAVPAFEQILVALSQKLVTPMS